MKEQNEKITKKRERSTPYPVLTLEEAIASVRQLKDSFGKGPYAREAIAKAIGHNKLTGPAARKVAALSHYGLLEKNGTAYTVSETTIDILNPVSEEQKKTTLIKSARAPRLFEKLFEQYKGESLPSRLDSILMREGVSESAAKEVVGIFTSTFEYVGLLKHGVLRDAPEAGDNKKDVKTLSDGSHGAQNPTSVPSIDTMRFNFPGGLILILPRNTEAESAVMDGGLKEARQALQNFAQKYLVKEDKPASSTESPIEQNEE